MMRPAKNPAEGVALFGEWVKTETIVLSCLQGVMGGVYFPAEGKETACALLGDFAFLAGKSSEKAVHFALRERSFCILVPQHEQWSRAIERVFGAQAKRTVRYALKKEGDVFDRELLRKAARELPPGCEIRLIDEELYEQCLREEWSCDLVSQFYPYSRYAEWGLGVAALQDGEIVAGASSYSRYLQGIEIEIDTRQDQRRRGLAHACGAALMLACLERGLYPSWDAQNTASLALAEKLGYHFSHEYPVYEVWPKP